MNYPEWPNYENTPREGPGDIEVTSRTTYNKVKLSTSARHKNQAIAEDLAFRQLVQKVEERKNLESRGKGRRK